MFHAPRSVGISNRESTLKDRGKTNVSLVITEPTPTPNMNIDPLPWNAATRSTPGMTNRMLDFQFSDQPSPFGSWSTKREAVPDDDATTPPLLRRKADLRMAAAAMFGLVLATIIFSRK